MADLKSLIVAIGSRLRVRYEVPVVGNADYGNECGKLAALDAICDVVSEGMGGGQTGEIKGMNGSFCLRVPGDSLTELFCVGVRARGIPHGEYGCALRIYAEDMLCRRNAQRAVGPGKDECSSHCRGQMMLRYVQFCIKKDEESSCLDTTE